MQTSTTPPRPQQQPDFAPPQAPPAGKKKKSRMGLILGGLAAAGILGFLALLAVGALILFFAIGSTSREQPIVDRPVDPQPVAEDDQQPADDQPPVEEPPAAEDGTPDSLIQDRVGDFALRQDEALPEVEDAGAIEARQVLYASPDGVEVVHQLSEWDSPEAAEQMLREQTESYASDGYEQAAEFEVTGRDGQRWGSGVALADSSGEEVVLWTNNDAFFVVIAPEGYGADFYDGLAY